MTEGKKILVVDDDEGVREYMETILSRQGFAAVVVESGEDVFEVLEEGDTDLVLLDLVLPGMDGFQVFKLVKERWPEMPIMILSGHGSSRNIVEAMRLGACDFLRKPFQVEELDEALQAVFASEGRATLCPTCHGTGRVSG